MNTRTIIRGLTAGYIVLFLLGTTWPGAMLINRVHPFVFGLPFNLFFIALLIVGALVILTALYFSEKRSER